MRYFLTVYDDYSHRISLTLMRMKSEALQSFKNFVNHAETQTGHKVQCIWSDRGGEFTSAAVQRYIREKGIEHVMVPPDAHAQNGRVERAHLTILNGVRTLLVETGLPASFWVRLLNKLPSLATAPLTRTMEFPLNAGMARNCCSLGFVHLEKSFSSGIMPMPTN